MLPRRGHLEVAKLLVERGADINAQDWKAFTTMAEEELNGYYDMVKFLIAHGAKELSFKSLKGEVVESSSKNLSIRVRDTTRPETIIVKVGLRTKFIPFRKPVGGEKVYVEYLDQDGSKYRVYGAGDKSLTLLFRAWCHGCVPPSGGTHPYLPSIALLPDTF